MSKKTEVSTVVDASVDKVLTDALALAEEARVAEKIEIARIANSKPSRIVGKFA